MSEKQGADVLEELRQSEERFGLLVNAVTDYAIFLLDPTGIIQSWNPGAERIKGYSAGEIIGKNFSIFYTPEDIARKHPQEELEIARRTGRYQEEGWRVRKDGTRFWANIVITRLLDQQGRLIGFGKVTRDLTERKMAEERLRESENRLRIAYQDLEKRISERTAELAASNEALKDREKALERAIRVRDEFLSIASHELKTPVTSLKLQLDMLSRKVPPLAPALPPAEKVRQALDLSLRQTKRLNDLIEDLLDVSRVQTGKFTLHFEEIDLTTLVQDVLQKMSTELKAVGCSLVFKGEHPIVARADPMRMEQVITNLLSNAVKYAPGKPVHVSIEKRPGTVTISVRDFGPGIPKEKQERIFERYERAVPASGISGMGLGLFIVRSIVEGHRGRIRVSSEPGAGAAFIIEIPA